MIACTIAGSDSGGGAGIQADLKTFQELDVFGTTVITALTAQNTTGVFGILPIPETFVADQLQAILQDFDVQAIKTGMLFNESIIKVVAGILASSKCIIVVDPVMIAKGGSELLESEAIDALKYFLLPIATVCTPNIPEAEIITGYKIKTEEDMYIAAEKILDLGVKYVVMKGGHLDELDAVDRVYWKGGYLALKTPRVQTNSTHGTGCTFSAALTAELAKGQSMKDALKEAKAFIQAAIATPLNLGKGFGPTNHFAYKKSKEKYEVFTNEIF